MLSDIDIAQAATLEPITTIASRLGIQEDLLEPYGRYKAKIHSEALGDKNADGKLILVTAINPTPAGEGKTTTSVGLADAFTQLGKRCVLALREPSLGPVFGIKGGAAGGGYAQVVPMEDINLHFTGDFHAIGAANNLLAALIDNHIKQGNELGIDPRRIIWRRCVDMNDRQLRNIVDGMGGPAHGCPREDGFDITVASEVMAAFCLAHSLDDLKERLGQMLVAYTYDQKPVYARELKAEGAMCALLKDALMPNLVQTLEHTPTLVHGGPFANIAHGCNSLIATETALKLGDYVVTEAGFGADLGAEKFLDIKCRELGRMPDAVVIVATVRALKYNGGLAKDQLTEENLDALTKGMVNLEAHVMNITREFGLPAVVALNIFPTDTEAELSLIEKKMAERDVAVSRSYVHQQGGKGGIDLAQKLEALINQTSVGEVEDHTIYPLETSLSKKIDLLAYHIYHATKVELSPKAQKSIDMLERLDYGKLPICVAKTQYSFSDDPTLLGAPSGYTLHVRDVKASLGAGFVVVYTGSIMTMPGLPKHPAAEAIDVVDGKIVGLF